MTPEQENASLRAVIRDLHWMARRYADGRSTFIPSTFNHCTRTLLDLGVHLHVSGDRAVFARDSMLGMVEVEDMVDRPYFAVGDWVLHESSSWRGRGVVTSVQNVYNRYTPSLQRVWAFWPETGDQVEGPSWSFIQVPPPSAMPALREGAYPRRDPNLARIYG